jgi:hypothetical protein
MFGNQKIANSVSTSSHDQENTIEGIHNLFSTRTWAIDIKAENQNRQLSTNVKEIQLSHREKGTH